MRLTTIEEKPQLTASVWCWDKQNENGAGVKDPNRYWEDHTGDGPWMYWESFWAPAEPAEFATTGPAFGDPEGAMLSTLLTEGVVAVADGGEVQRACTAALINQ